MPICLFCQVPFFPMPYFSATRKARASTPVLFLLSWDVSAYAWAGGSFKPLKASIALASRARFSSMDCFKIISFTYLKHLYK